MFNEDIRSRKLLSQEFARSASAVFREGADKIAHINDDDLDTIAVPQARNFGQLCESLNPAGAHAYAMYRAMSAYVHPGGMLMDQYLIPDDEGEAGVMLRAEPAGIGHQSWLFLSVASMMWAARALDMMQRDRPHRDYLRGVARVLEVPDVLQLTPAARAAEQRAEAERRRALWKGRKRKHRTDASGVTSRDSPRSHE